MVDQDLLNYQIRHSERTKSMPISDQQARNFAAFLQEEFTDHGWNMTCPTNVGSSDQARIITKMVKAALARANING